MNWYSYLRTSKVFRLSPWTLGWWVVFLSMERKPGKAPT